MPSPVIGEAPDATPALENSLTAEGAVIQPQLKYMAALTGLATQALPLTSIAIENGVYSPPPVYPAAGEMAAPVAPLIFEIELFEFAVQTSPTPSIATLSGEFIPPPV